MAMKRKASRALESGVPLKLTKKITKDSGELSLTRQDTAEASALEPMRLPSYRQKKVPAWLSSYVTASTSKEMAQATKEALKKAEQAKKEKKAEKQKLTKIKPQPPPSSLPRFPTLVPPSKRKAKTATAQSEVTIPEETSEEPPSLRRQSTLKLDESPPQAKSKSMSMLDAINHTPSLTKKATEILTASDVDSDITLDAASKPVLSSKSSSAKQKGSVTKLPSKRGGKAHSSIRVYGVDAEEFSTTTTSSTVNVMEICDAQNEASSDSGMASNLSKAAAGSPSSARPKMVEVVICISTSGSLREYLNVLQDRVREMVWRLQSLIPNLRIGVMAHTQGGIHDDKAGSGGSVSDHNYIRTGGHSGTKWLDLGATLSQICAFVDSLETEATIYPDYVQDNLEMALWKLQRSMSWSSFSYRSVVMIGRGRPNRTSFYLQREHWRGWIRSALELGPRLEIPVIDWELEAKLLAQMAIHVFTIQAVSRDATTTDDEEDEGTTFFRRVAEITHGQHIRVTQASNIGEIIVGICCACHGPELLQDHRDTVRDENDGFVPLQLRDVFVSLQLHSKRHSLSTLPASMANLPAVKPSGPAVKTVETTSGDSSSEEEESPAQIKKKQKGVGASEGNKGAKSQVARKKLVNGARKTKKGEDKNVKAKSSLKPVKPGGVKKTVKSSAQQKATVKKAIKKSVKAEGQNALLKKAKPVPKKTEVKSPASGTKKTSDQLKENGKSSSAKNNKAVSAKASTKSVKNTNKGSIKGNNAKSPKPSNLPLKKTPKPKNAQAKMTNNKAKTVANTKANKKSGTVQNAKPNTKLLKKPIANGQKVKASGKIVTRNVLNKKK